MVVRLLTRRSILRLPRVRLSFLDPKLDGDTWIGACTHPQLLVMHHNSKPIALVAGSSLEMASLNQILFVLRNKRRRQRNASKTGYSVRLES